MSLDSELHKIQDQDILLERILSYARQITGADAGSIYIKNNDSLEIKYAQNDTKEKELVPGQKLIYKFFTLPINKSTIAGYVAVEEKPLNIPNYYEIPRNAPYSHNAQYDKNSGYYTKSMFAIPLISSADICMGILQIINKKKPDGTIISFDKDDEQLIGHFANTATIALERAYLTRAIIQRMVQMAELRDPKETGPHVNRVAGYSLEIYDRWAFKMGIPEEQRNEYRDIFRMSSMLHDVGKVGISDLILKKPGKFSEEEYDIMKTHTKIGSNLFDKSGSAFDLAARDVALTHHENWDGTGYPGHIDPATGIALKKDSHGKPLGKKGDEIPLFGRIVAIADVYDALRSQRVYKKAWSEDDVLAELRKLSGIKFDPDLIDIFFEIYDQLQIISDQYVDNKESA
ncbi:MAG: GAF and HD-GYP domain-containing protein [Salinispira sp.]